MHTSPSRLLLPLVLLTVAGCGADAHRPMEDAGPLDAFALDGGDAGDLGDVLDASDPPDSTGLDEGVLDDLGIELVDAGGVPVDGGGDPVDAGTPDAGPELCDTPGATETVACGRCGSTVRFCSAEGAWVLGACADELGCLPGTTRATACGNCGTQAERCSVTCAWEAEGTCSGEGECAPGTLTRTASGCAAGELREVECSSSCAFAAVGGCESASCATPGAIENVPCGARCGTMPRFCGAGNVWSYGTCGLEGVCEPGTTTPVPCGDCGTRTSTCALDCTWGAGGTCSGEGVCTPGETAYTSGGCPPDASRQLTCSTTCAFEPGACVPRECTTGAVESVACGMCGTLVRTCDALGRWQNGACTGEGVCAPDAIGAQPCGLCGSQATLCSAACTWAVSGACGGETVCIPPASTCVDATTIRTNNSAPTCAAGVCSYSSFDVRCGGTCSGGMCTGPIMLRGLGGAGFGLAALPANDDGSSASISLAGAFPAGLRVNDTSYTAAFVNNNGNVSLGGTLASVSAMFPVSPRPMFAPWWGDVDTRSGGAPARNSVNWYLDGSRMIVTWYLVGYYTMHDTLQNSFQLILTNRSDVAPGDFDVEYRYEQCAWTTGDASGGVGGLGGTPAAAGFDAGNMIDSFELPGSRTAAVLDLCTTSNVGLPGVWRYSVRGGVVL